MINYFPWQEFEVFLNLETIKIRPQVQLQSSRDDQKSQKISSEFWPGNLKQVSNLRSNNSVENPQYKTCFVIMSFSFLVHILARTDLRILLKQVKIFTPRLSPSKFWSFILRQMLFYRIVNSLKWEMNCWAHLNDILRIFVMKSHSC